MLPTDRHFDCMKKCPMDCGKVCKRLAYPRLVSALLDIAASDHIGIYAEIARKALAEIGETKKP